MLLEKRYTLESSREEIESIINSELKPKVDSLKQSLAEYRNSIESQNETDILSRFESEMINQLEEIQNEKEDKLKFKTSEYFDSQIIETINSILNKILTLSNFDNFSSVHFILETVDILVNGKDKSSYGKGYRAFLNTVVALAFMEYLTKHGVYSPGLLIIDSPILSLKEKGIEKASDTMKKSLFQYMLDNQDNGQIIIIENEIPNIDYSKANMIYFSKDINVGRYGLLKGMTD